MYNRGNIFRTVILGSSAGFSKFDFELELLQHEMKHNPVQRGEVSVFAWRVFGQTREEVWASAGLPEVLGCAYEGFI